MIPTIKQLHRGYQVNPNRNLSAKPNVYRRSLEPRETTDSFLRLAAGLDSYEIPLPWYRRLLQWMRR